MILAGKGDIQHRRQLLLYDRIHKTRCAFADGIEARGEGQGWPGFAFADGIEARGEGQGWPGCACGAERFFQFGSVT